MHVRELPTLLFNKLVSAPENVRIGDHLSDDQPHRGEEWWYDTVRHIGEVSSLGETALSDVWLRLSATDDTTTLSIHGSRSGAILNEDSGAFAALSAGNASTGVWKAGGGQQRSQSYWLSFGRTTHEGEQALSQLEKLLMVTDYIRKRLLEMRGGR